MIRWSHAPTARAAARSGRRASERGETLIEVMVTVVLLGTGFVAILTSIFTATNISDVNQQRTKSSITVQAVAESLQQPARTPTPAQLAMSTFFPQQAYTYTPCATPAAYGDDGGSHPAPGGIDVRAYGLPDTYKATIVKIRYFTGFSGGVPQFTSAGLSQGAATNLCYDTLYSTKTVKDISGLPCPAPPGDPSGCQPMYVDRGLQEITLRVDSGVRRERIIDTLVVIKRDQRCPGTYDNADLGPC